jgi:arsenate reductase
MTKRNLTLYWLPHCSTCQKAAQYLEQRGHTVAKFRDIKSDPLDRSEVEQLTELVGGAGELFSRRARKYREMNLSERELSTDDMLKLMAEEYTFIKRPVLVSGNGAVAGFSAKSYDTFLEEK